MIPRRCRLAALLFPAAPFLVAAPYTLAAPSILAASFVLNGCARVVGLDELREDPAPLAPAAPGELGVAGSTNAPDVSPSGGSGGSASIESAGASPRNGAGSSTAGVGTGGSATTATPSAPLGAAAPDAGPAALPAESAAVCGQQLLVNGAFDEGSAGWNEIWDARQVLFSAGDPLLVAAGVAPQSGSTLAWIGGVPNGEFGQKYTSSIQQEVVIPSDAIALSVSGQIWVQQPELGQPFPAVDWVVLELLDPTPADGPSIAWQIETWSDADVSPGWVAFEALNINEIAFLRGRRLLLSAASRPDGNGTLSVWIDSLRLEARCP